MKPASFAIRCSAVLCGALLHTLPLAAAAVDFAAMPAARLTLLPDRYVLDGREYYDRMRVVVLAPVEHVAIGQERQPRRRHRGEVDSGSSQG